MNLSRIVSFGTTSPALTERKLGIMPMMRLGCSSSDGAAFGMGAVGSGAGEVCAGEA
jgi:hypothetical protein